LPSPFQESSSTKKGILAKGKTSHRSALFPNICKKSVTAFWGNFTAGLGSGLQPEVSNCLSKSVAVDGTAWPPKRHGIQARESNPALKALVTTQ
jgi:hypothetical protein